MEILNSVSMSEADRITIEETGIPSIILMENAAKSVFEFICSLEADNDKIAIVAGWGNNAGDGFALARHLANNGFIVDVFVCGGEKLKNDAKLNYDILFNLPVSIIELQDEAPQFENYDITVDALFGTGLNKEPEGFFAELIDSINETSNYIVSIDIPSGLSGSSHNVEGVCVDADTTVTFCRPKIPHCMYPAKKFCGEVIVSDISIPDFNVEKVSDNLYFVTEAILPPISARDKDSHKGTYGHAVIVGGSAGKTGAALIASNSCARSGSGLVTCMLPAKLNYAVECGNHEIMSFPLGSEDFFCAENVNEAANFLADKTVFSLGTGIGRETDTGEFVRKLISETSNNLILDADGLYHMNDETLGKLRNRAVLTPHIGEFARITNLSTTEVLAGRLDLARDFAKHYGIVLVLKSSDTIIASPEGITFINANGNPALAKGGSGDCLAGLITGFVAQKYSLAEAAVLGCYILGEAARKAVKKQSERSVLTNDIINKIGSVISNLES